MKEMIEWTSAFLKSRKQKVRINETLILGNGHLWSTA
jgi:hypothetical protein